jgi:glycosyltransferase involved in cell wall biosynthesis
MEKNLQEERRRNPEWSEFLQGAVLPRERRRILEREIELASDIVVPSTFAKRTFVESGVDSARVHVISLGADRVEGDDGDQFERPQGDLTPRRPLRVMFAGQVNERKGISYLLDAVAAIGAESIQLELVGPVSTAMRHKLSTSYPEVLLRSPMPRRELMRRMQTADLLALPSLAEGFGLVALESMAVGTPAVVSDRTFATDVITSGVDGWVVPAGSMSSLTRLLQDLAARPQSLAVVGQHAQQTASRYTWKRYTLAVQDFLSSGR